MILAVAGYSVRATLDCEHAECDFYWLESRVGSLVVVKQQCTGAWVQEAYEHSVQPITIYGHSNG